MYRLLLSVLALLLAGLILSPSVQAAQPPSASRTKASGAVTAPGQNWDAILNEAKKEGTVAIYNTAWASKMRVDLTQAFQAKYGINLEFSPFTRGAELVAKVQTEQRAGLYLADVFGAGAPTLMTSMKPVGLLGPLEPHLVLPEAMDGKYWFGGKFPFVDKDKTTVGMIAQVRRDIVYNTALIKKGEITTYKDLLKPQYRGKITLNDPSVAGSGNELLRHLALNIWNLEETKAYLAQLLKQQETVIERDNRQHVESVVRGKYAIGLGASTGTLSVFLKAGSPLEAVIIKEGVPVGSGAGCIGVPTRMAHPNAAKVFINWLLSREGQTVFAKSFGSPSMRNDISLTEFNQAFAIQPGEKIFLTNEEFILFTDDITEIAKKIIDDAYKK